MKIIESKPKPSSKSGRLVRNSGSSQKRIVIENIYECRAEPNDGAAVQMTLLFLTTRPFWVRASKLAVGHFHSLAHGGSRSRSFNDREVISNSEAWFVKVVCTLFVRSQSLDSYVGYLSKNLTPLIAFEVIKRLDIPKLGLKFFELSRSNLSLNHPFRTYNLLMRSLCQMGFHDSAKFIFDCMRSDGHSPDNSVIEFLVSSYAQVGKLDFGEKVLEELQCDEVRVSVFVYNSLLNVLVKRNLITEAVCLFRKYVASHFDPDTWTFNILIRGLCGIRELHTAFGLFDDMENFGCSPDIVTYNTLISGLCRINQVDRGCKLLQKVQSSSELSPNVITFTSVISGYCKLGRIEEASALFDEMIISRIKPNAVTFNALIDGFGKAGDMATAIALFEKMPFHGSHPDVITFTSLIDGYCRSGQLNLGLKLWREMNARNVAPNGYTFSVLIHALCKDNRLHEARDFLRQLNRSNLVSKPFMYNPVVDGLCKAGNVDEANMIVAEMEEKRCNPDKLTFTILILGNCMKGRLFEAIGIFNKMMAVGCAPDKITVDSLVSCLFKAGMCNEAIQIKKTAVEDLYLDVSCLRNVHSRTNAEIQVAV
ncbi:Pentatricopeptide repeat [Parasponia andersonii]|uniref:Pentatricopeptide repeat n=1 Tax=Parasponia andersonii TaxID=3476 RepID=A0A2P5AXP3_PARAD|nr:Pentatricopeptide repeat [Parasponia andersonii]